jgi:hypothetical protein
MITGVLQDWTTQRADNSEGVNIYSIIQGEIGYLDLAEYDDVVLYLDVREVSVAGHISIAYETAVSCDDASFVAMVPSLLMSVASTPVVTSVLAAYAAVPLARYLRWHLTVTTSAPWDVCFRITYAAYAPGA